MSLILTYLDSLIYYENVVHNPSDLLSALHMSVSHTECFPSLINVMCPLNRMSKLYHQLSKRFTEEQILFPVLGFHLWLPCHLVRCLFSTLNTLSQLETTNKLFIFNCWRMASTSKTWCVLVIIRNNTRISQCDRQKKCSGRGSLPAVNPCCKTHSGLGCVYLKVQLEPGQSCHQQMLLMRKLSFPGDCKVKSQQSHER